MPYIDPKEREDLEKFSGAVTTGELNYEITTLVLEYVRKNGVAYSTFNDIAGAMVLALLEAYRRLVAPYEDTKRLANGDVYPEELRRKAGAP